MDDQRLWHFELTFEVVIDDYPDKYTDLNKNLITGNQVEFVILYEDGSSHAGEAIIAGYSIGWFPEDRVTTCEITMSLIGDLTHTPSQ